MSTKIVIKTTDRVVPMIYAYTTPEIARHNGWTKIGYTEQDVDKRLSQQTHTADVEYKEEWRGNATFEDGSGDTFTDKDFHRYLRKLNIENDPKNEWFHVTGPVSRNHFYDFRANRGILQSLTAATPYNLREEQEDAVEKTLDYSRLHTKGEYLWNAKPRFGKTLTAYELCKQMDADTVLIVTNRPAIANSWYSDYEKFLGPDSGYLFVSDTSSLQGKPFVVSRNQYLDMLNNDDYKCIEFVSLQDLKGSIQNSLLKLFVRFAVHSQTLVPVNVQRENNGNGRAIELAIIERSKHIVRSIDSVDRKPRILLSKFVGR